MELSATIVKLAEDYASKVKKEFEGRDPIVVLYGSSLNSVTAHDFDVVLFLHNYDDEDMKKISEITHDFHVRNGMIIDDEVPYSNKLIYTFFDIERMLIQPPFQVKRNHFFIQPINKNEEFLSSDCMKLRLLQNILCDDTQCILGNGALLDNYRKRAWENLIRIVYSNIRNEYLSEAEFIENLYKNPYGDEEGEFYIGFTRSNMRVSEYLKSKVAELFSALCSKGKLIQKDGRYCCDIAWMYELINQATSNNLNYKLIDFKITSKMLGDDYSENANPLGPPEELCTSIREMSQYINIYPDYKNIDINNKLAKFLHTDLENTVVCNGSLEAIYAIPRFLDASKTSIVVPTYWGYAAGLEAIGITEYNHVQFDKDFEFDLDAMKKAAADSTMMFICNPNNPTSSYLCKSKMLELVRSNPDCHFVIDESHLLLHDYYDAETLSSMIEELGNVSIVYSLSKLFSVAGFRVGALVANKEVIAKFKKWQVPYSLNTIAQNIFPIALEDDKFVQKTRIEIHELVKELIASLKNISYLRVKDSITNFVLCEVTGKITAVELAAKLEEDGIYIREMTTSYSEINGEWIRISVGTKELNKRLIDKLKSYDIKS